VRGSRPLQLRTARVFSKGLLGYLPANILQGIVGFAALMAFTRVLSPTDYGAYVLALGVSSIAYTLVFTWMESAMARFYPAEKNANPDAPLLYGTIYRLFVLIALLFLGLLAAAAALWPTHGENQHALKLAIVIGLLSNAPRSLVKLAQEQRRSVGRVREAAGIDMLMTGGGFVLALAFALLGLKGASPLAGAGVMALLVMPFVVREDWGRAFRGQFSAKAAKAYSRYGYPISLSLIMTIALYTVDRFMIAHYLSEADAGAYHAGFSIASRVIDVLFVWFGAAGAPAMIHALESGGEGALREEARRQITLMALVLFPAVAGVIAMAGPLSSVLIGESLRGRALSITPLVTLGALLAGMNNGYFLLSFTLAKKTRLLVIAMAIPAVANIALNWLLIPRLGLVGAAGAYLASFALGVLAAWALGFKARRMPTPLLELGKIAGAAAVMAALLALIPPLGVALDLMLKPALGVLIYAALAYGLDLGGARGFADKALTRMALGQRLMIGPR
jgi:O-antigen/teichoic acid export membrane protein